MNLKYIDNHAHLNFKVFEDDLEEVVLRMKDRGVGAILVGTNQATSQMAIELANKYDNLWAIVGLHPIHTDASFHDSDEIGSETKPFESKGEIDKAIEFKQKGLKTQLEILGSEHLEIARSYNSLAASYHSKGEIDKAIEYLQKSLEILLKM